MRIRLLRIIYYICRKCVYIIQHLNLAAHTTKSEFLVYLKTRNVAHFWYTTPAKIITPAWQFEIRLEYKGSFDLR